MLVVADTSPLNYLVLVGAVDVLRAMYGRVVVPTAAADELSVAAAPLAVRQWLAARPEWLEVRSVAGKGD